MSDQKMDEVLDALHRGRQRATYGAVAVVVDRPRHFLMGGRPRDHRHSLPNHPSMDCPVDRGPLTRVDLEAGEPGLLGFTCGKCAGHWLRFGDYLSWRERQTGDAPEVPAETASEAASAPPDTARRCPDCGHLLARHRVGRGVPFALDRCGNCNGVWLDAGEWATLRGRGLYDNVHEMFGPGWQSAARAEERRQLVDAQFQRQLGADFGRTREFAEWLVSHPRRSEILAYIQSRIR